MTNAEGRALARLYLMMMGESAEWIDLGISPTTDEQTVAIIVCAARKRCPDRGPSLARSAKVVLRKEILTDEDFWIEMEKQLVVDLEGAIAARVAHHEEERRRGGNEIREGQQTCLATS